MADVFSLKLNQIGHTEAPLRPFSGRTGQLSFCANIIALLVEIYDL